MIFIKRFLRKNITQLRYIISGCFFTLIAPSLFLLLTKTFHPQLSIIISECIIHIFRFNVITRWVFQTSVNKKTLKAYIKATIPIFIFNFILVSLLAPVIGELYTAIILGLFSATVGFLWNKICYGKQK